MSRVGSTANHASMARLTSRARFVEQRPWEKRHGLLAGFHRESGRQAAAKVTWRGYLLLVGRRGQRCHPQRLAVHHAYTQILTDSFVSVNSPPVSLLGLPLQEGQDRVMDYKTDVRKQTSGPSATITSELWARCDSFLLCRNLSLRLG